MKIGKKLLFLLSLISLFCFSINSVEASSRSMKSYVKKVLRKNHARGSVAIIKNGNVQVINEGYASYHRRIHNGSKKVVYPLGSLQKLVTGALIEQLMTKGKLTQNTKISRWYPNLRNSSKITVGQLLTHTSGISMYGTESTHHRRFSESGAINWTLAQCNYQSQTARGSFNYNNANYVLLAGIIRKVTHHSYASNVKKRIIKPLRLKKTFVYNKIPHKKTDAVSYLYLHGNNYQSPSAANPNVVSQLPGAGNLFSSPNDYRKIVAGLQNGKILNKEQFHHLTHLSSKKTTYSGGLYLKKGGKLQLAYGNFGNTHFSNWMQITKDNQNGIVIFLNQTRSGNKPAKKIGYKILKHLKSGVFIKG